MPSPSGPKKVVPQVAVSLVAVVLAVVHVARPKWHIDPTTVALVVIALLPWLGGVFESVKTPFGDFKYRKLEQQVSDAAGAAKSVEMKLQYAAHRSDGEPLTRDASQVPVSTLAKQYSEIRQTLKPSYVRTQRMTALASAMSESASATEAFDWSSHLDSEDVGTRLAGYAYLYDHPTEEASQAIADRIPRESQPFAQYWAIVALGACLNGRDPRVALSNFEGLERLEESMAPGTDRKYELRRIFGVTS
jgi:hypothetical protein